MSEVLIRRDGSVGQLSLNRPQAIHALTYGMVLAMTEALRAWREDPVVECVIIDHAEGRGFCSGGDINLLRHSALSDGGVAGRRFFFDEYRLNTLLFEYPKPVVAFMDGITMGGGVGISQPARFRVATGNTRFAMPETGIGLFPDVGGGWYLSRLTGRLGVYLALTGARLDGADCIWAGLATHYVEAGMLDEAKRRIVQHPAHIADALGALSVAPPPAKIAAHEAEIDRLFASDRLEDILAALAADPGDWAQAQLAALKHKSPQALKVTLRQLEQSKKLNDFRANMAMEYRLGSRVITRPDFAEGVRALIVDKDNSPRWDPPTPAGMSDALLDAIFAPLSVSEEWTAL